MTRVGLSGIQHWIVSAWWPEQRQLADDIAGSQGLHVFNEHISVSGRFGFLRTGVGTPRAAAAVANALALGKSHGSCAESVVFLATAGAYSSQISIGKAFCISEVAWTDGDLLTQKAYLPGLTAGKEKLVSKLSAFKNGHTAVSTPGITLDAHLATQLAQQGELENLELYGVALAAEQFEIAWGAVLGVSNTVGPDAHQQWKENHLAASKAAQDRLLESYLRTILE